VPDSPASSLESVELDHIFNSPATRLLRWRFDHDDDIPFPLSQMSLRTSGSRNRGTRVWDRLWCAVLL